MPTTMLVTFENGEVWGVPCAVVAKSRAEHYARRDADDGDGDYDTLYKEEYEYAINDQSELSDWSANNMNWSDLAPHATRVEQEPKPVDYEDLWSGAQRDYIS